MVELYSEHLKELGQAFSRSFCRSYRFRCLVLKQRMIDRLNELHADLVGAGKDLCDWAFSGS